MGIKHLAILACALIVGQTAAARERFQLQLNDQEFRGASTLHLKQLLQQQHRVNADRYQLVGIRLIAKSHQGQGTAALRVGRWTSNDKRVNGSPMDWRNDRPATFDQVDFNNNAPNDRGVWQVELQGNIKVRRVAVILERQGNGGGGGGGGLIRYQNLRCNSNDHRPATCEVNGRIVSLRLLQQHSNAPCIENRTFGASDRGVWVSNGCRATFEVGTR